jgi:predicted nucleic acid-binding protein
VAPVVAVLDSSPLIIFHQIGRLDLLRDVFDELVAPPAVAREIAPSLGRLPDWVSEQEPLVIPGSVLTLDAGEREAIALAIRLAADVILLDDLAGRRRAIQLGLSIVGSAGVLVQAHRRGLLDVVRPNLDAMLTNGLFVSRHLYAEILEAVGETEA